MTKDTTAAIVISNASQIPVAFDSAEVKKKAAEVARQCNAIVITDESSLTIGSGLLKDANKLVLLIEKKRKALKQPSMDIGKEIDRVAKELSDAIISSVASGKQKILDYNKIVEENKKVEEVRLEKLRKEAEEKDRVEKERIFILTKWISDFENDCIAEVNGAATTPELAGIYQARIKSFPADTFFEEFLETAKAALTRVKEAGKQRKLYLEQLAKTTNEDAANELAEQEQVRQEAVSQQLDEANIDLQEEMNNKLNIVEMNTGMANAAIASEQMESDNQKVSGVTKRWTYEVVDIDLVPSQMMCVDDKKVTEYMKLNKEILRDGEIINGIKFYQEKGVALR